MNVGIVCKVGSELQLQQLWTRYNISNKDNKDGVDSCKLHFSHLKSFSRKGIFEILEFELHQYVNT